jgi:hypothetical protein
LVATDTQQLHKLVLRGDAAFAVRRKIRSANVKHLPLGGDAFVRHLPLRGGALSRCVALRGSGILRPKIRKTPAKGSGSSERSGG